MKKRNYKGITLIALVVTIVVLLILASVSITTVFGDNGILQLAKEAREKTNEAVQSDKENIGNMTNYIKSLSWDTTKVTAVTTKDGGVVPVPKGFVGSEIEEENTIKNGFVIYEGKEQVTDIDSDSNGISDAKENRNQYVWIPVNDINSMIMCKENNKNNDGTICNIELKGEELVCTTHNNSTDLAGRLYGGDELKKEVENNKIIYYSPNFNQKDQTYESGTSEPSVVQGDSEQNIKLPELQNDFNEMAKSVAAYGGFYISRYEIGENGNSKMNKAILTSCKTTTDESIYLKGNSWFSLYESTKKYDSMTNTNMIWGCQYDQVIKFIGDEAIIGHNNDNYQKTSMQKSGYTKPMKNIYDLEGNFKEWTMESFGLNTSNCRIIRGGDYTNALKSEFRAAGLRQWSGTNDNSSCFTCHSTLFVSN